MLKHAIAGAILSASMMAATPLAAKNITADVEQIAQLLQSEGYQAKLQGEGEDRHIKTGMAGYNFLILPFDCDGKGENCKSVQFYAAFTAENKPTLEEMNTYAAENRFGRIYLDSDRDPVIEMDIDLEAGGMSPALFMDNLAYWEAVMVSFADFSFSKDED
ncbi:YbjN domain-containing protein [Qipengyuania sp. 1NDH17]|uniref:YbjN domain-containing protein n=1 Tax=Qipengyuania polymorpha TaxID=2867234 RepID=A0ABS7IVG5_9SPHN|nr:YbjN domain-containing protein [Qipengyuania polymorpha]MBX7457459.1 YbjN domain-containing protein [Qipengyuania polymorpha]